jgi:nitroreductase
MRKPAETAFPLYEVIAERWSPRAFAETPPSDAELGSILEAGRWAASCFNDQPWRFIVGIKGRGDAWQRLYEALMPGNQAWCIRVPVLMVSVAVPSFRHNGTPNRHWQHDVGMASAQMAVQATSMGLALHFMAGFDRGKVRAAFAVPEGHEPMAAIALGHPAEPDVLPADIAAKELMPRSRLGLNEIIFGARWGEALPLG